VLLTDARLGDRIVDLRIEDGVITEIGPDLERTGDVESLDGRWISPGLWDQHVHFTQWALSSQRVDLATATSAREAASIIGRAIDSGAGEAGIVIGAGFRDGLWPDAPNLADLDAATGALPAVLVSGDLHCVWLNTSALQQFGHAGHRTGLLTEDTAFAITEQLGTVPDETIDSWARSAATAAARRGVVGIMDFEMAWNAGAWMRRLDAGHDALRVEYLIYPQHLDRAIAEGMRTGQTLAPLLTVGGLKVLTDGSLNTRTAYTDDPYDDGGHGLLTVPPDQLVPLMRKACEAGILPDVHAIGDHANSLALDAFEEVGCTGRIEHAQLLRESDYPRFAALGVEASVQPEHAMDDREVAEHHWAGRTARTYAFRSLLDAGATLRFGSDAPVAPLDPWVAMAAAVSRSRDGREPWHPEQRISNAEAVAASVRSAIAVGEPGDIVVTDLDPLTTSGEQLRTMPVAATLLAGRFTHDAR
jgi:predicted amidohydrolase YtcJ